MIRIATLICLVAILLAAGTLFRTSYQVRDLRRELAGINSDIVREQTGIRVLRAEWAYLNSPDRLRQMSHDLTLLENLEPTQLIAGVADLPVPLPRLELGDDPVLIPDGMPMAGLRLPPHKPPPGTMTGPSIAQQPLDLPYTTVATAAAPDRQQGGQPPAALDNAAGEAIHVAGDAPATRSAVTRAPAPRSVIPVASAPVPAPTAGRSTTARRATGDSIDLMLANMMVSRSQGVTP